MSQPEKSKQTFWFVDKKKHEGSVTVTVKLACDKDIVAAEYSESFSEYDSMLSPLIKTVISHYPANTDVFKTSSGGLKKVTTSCDETRRRHDV